MTATEQPVRTDKGLARVACLAATSLATMMAAYPAAAWPTPDADTPAGSPSPAKTEQGGALVAEGEHIPDIDNIIPALDRRTPVNAVAFSPAGDLIASGSEDHVVRVWNLAARRLALRLAGHSSPVTAVAFSPNGGVIASASNDRTVRLWDARSGRLLRTLQGHVYHVYAVAFDPRGRWLATASWDRTVVLWDAESGVLVKKLRGANGPIRAIDFSRDGRALAAGSDDSKIRLWNVEKGEAIKVLDGHTGPVTSVRFSPDGERVFSGSADQTVRMWSVSDGTMARQLGDCGAPVLSLAVASNGQTLGGACAAAGSVLWDIPTSTRLPRARAGSADVRAIAFSPDGRLVASGADDGAILVEDVATGRRVASLSAGIAQLQAVTFSPDGTKVAATSGDGQILIWQDAGDHKELSRVLASGPGRALAFSPDGRTIATGGEDGDVAVWALHAAEPARHFTGHHGPVRAVAFVPDGRTLISAGDDATVRSWNVKTGAEVRGLKGHLAPVRALATSPDGALVASGSDDATARVWEVATGRSLAVLRTYGGPVTSVGFGGDGKLLAIGSQDGTSDVWSQAKGRLLKPMQKVVPGGVAALAARGSRLAVASSDGIISIWDFTGRRPNQQSSRIAGAVCAIAFAPDGGVVASASRDGVLQLWDAKTLERRWSMAGNSRERWLACNSAQTCWRSDDGTLLVRGNDQGGIAPISPSDDGHRTSLVVSVDWRKLGHEAVLVEDKPGSIPLHIENRGAQPAYFVSVFQTVTRTASNRTSLVAIPPATIPRLAAGAGVDVALDLSALGEYENPQPRSDVLRLSVTSASSTPSSVEIPVRVDAPHLALRDLTLRRGAIDAVAASVSEVFMAQSEPVRLHISLALEGERPSSIAPIVLEQPFYGQDLVLSFPLPGDLQVGRRSLATFTVRKSTHPAHVWTVVRAPIHVPLPSWLWPLLAAGTLGLGGVVWRARLYVRARPLGRVTRRLLRLAVTVVAGVVRAFLGLLFIHSTLRTLRDHLQRRRRAGIFFHMQPETQCSHLARQLGASWVALANGHVPVFELRFGAEVALNVTHCLLVLSADGSAVAAALAQLATAGNGRDAITVVLSDVPRSQLAERSSDPRRLVVLSKAMVGQVLRAPQPGLAFAQAVSLQIDRAGLSLYQPAARGGQRQPFYGRKAELRRLMGDLRKNCLIIGPDGIGKTSLLDEVYRRLRGQPTVACYYLALADGDLASALADALSFPGPPSLGPLLHRLSKLSDAKRVVVLCDDADAWAMRDAAEGGGELQALASLNQEQRCSFVLSGFLGLLLAARPLPGRRAVGDAVRLDALDAEACAEFATVPMAALNLHYADAELAGYIARQSGGMPGLLTAICDQVVARLAPDQRTIDRSAVEGACKSDAVARIITAWRPRFGLREPRFAAIDQTVVLSAIFKGHFTLQDLQSTLAGLRVQATAVEIEHSARRLVAACVFEHWLGHFRYRVPLFQTVMQESALARMIAQ